MNWMYAMSIMNDGGRVTRKGWPPNRQLFIAHKPEDISNPPPIIPPSITFPIFCLKEDPPNRIDLNYKPEPADLLSKDWDRV